VIFNKVSVSVSIYWRHLTSAKLSRYWCSEDKAAIKPL